MNPSSNTPNPGTSINFDAQALHDAEEAEYQREEAERQNELRQLLTCAFDCDLSEEEDSLEDNTSQTNSSHNVSSTQQDGEPNILDEDGEEWHADGGQFSTNQLAYLHGTHSSTPVNGLAPPLVTPATNRYPYPDASQQQDGGVYSTPQPQEFEGHQLIQIPYGSGGGGGGANDEIRRDDNQGVNHPHHHQGFVVHQDVMIPERGEIEGANANDNVAPSASALTEVQISHHHQHHHQQYNMGNYEAYQYHQRPDVYDGQDADQQENSSPQHQHHIAPQQHQQQQQLQQYPAHDHEQVHPWGGAPPQPTEQHSPRLPPTQQQKSPPTHHHHHHQPHHHDQYTNNDVAHNSDIPASPREHNYQYPNKELEHFKVQYTGGGSVPRGDVSTDSVNDSELGNSLQRPATPGDEGHNSMQRDFLASEGHTESRQNTQLEILYRARGNKIEELITELKHVKDDSDREIRILKHKVTLVEGEKDGYRSSLDQSQQLLHESRQVEETLRNNTTELERQLEMLGVQKQELLDRVGTAESAIENLNMQLMDIGSSETLARVREQHNDIVSGLKQKHNDEILTLKLQLDNLSADNQEKTEAANDLKKQVTSLTRELGSRSVDQAETVNKLTRSLDESQRQNRDLLVADGLGTRGVSHEMGNLKMQVQEAIATKSITEDMNMALQDEVKELKEQLTMYESVSQFGITTSTTVNTGISSIAENTGPLDDSYAQLGIKKPSDSQEDANANLTNYETVHGMKKELERCLVMYKAKREQLSEVQNELKTFKSTFEENKIKMEKNEKELQETKVKLSLKEMSRSGASSLKEVRLQKEMDKVFNEKENLRIEYEDKLNGYVNASECGANSLKEAKLQLELTKISQEKGALNLQNEEIRQRLDEVAASEEKLTEMNREIQSQMAQMVREYDDDKRMAVEKAQEACLRHIDETKQKLREELQAAHQTEQEELKIKHQENITKLKDELQGVQDELDEVKELYVSVCKDKDELEETLNTDWEQKMKNKIQEIENQLLQEKESDVEEIKTTLASEHHISLAAQRKKWEEEQQEQLKRTIELKVEESRIHWVTEHQTEKQVAVEAAIQKVQDEDEQHLAEILEEERQTWLIKAEEDYEHKLQEARLKWNTDKRVSFERELQERLKTAKDTWTSTELPHLLDDAQRNWNKDLFGDSNLDEKLNKAVNDARKEWRLKEKKHREHSENKIRELSKLVVDVEAKVEKANWELKQELNQSKEEKKSIEQRLEELEAEKLQLIQDTDSEKKNAIKEAQDQCEKDYKVFLHEHQDTLNKALKSARQEFDQEKEKLIKTHVEEMEMLQKKLEEKQTTNYNIKQELETQEISWQKKLDDLSQKFMEEKEKIMASHRDSLHQSIEEARSRWQQQMESMKEERDQLSQKSADWEDEKVQYQAEINRLEQLLQTADEHMETEIAKLHVELNEAHQKEIEEKLGKEVNKVESDLSEKLSQISNEKGQMGVKLEDTRSLLKELEAKYKKDTANLAEKARSYKHELQSTRKQLEDKWQTQEGIESQKDQISQQLKEAIKQLEKSEKMKQELAGNYQKSEAENSQIINSYKTRQSELNVRVQLLEKQMKAVEIESQKQLIVMQESMEREQTATLDKMKCKISEMRASHKLAMEASKKEFADEIEQLKREIETLQNQRRSMTNTPTQTDHDNGVVNETIIAEVKKHYIRAVTKMKIDVIKHVKNSNELAAETVKIEVLKERQKTAKRLRKYYMQCLSDLLDKDCDRASKEQKMKKMQLALEHIPDSCTTSRTATPSMGMRTPVEETPRSSTALQHNSASHSGGNRSSSRGKSGDRSQERTPESRASTRSSHSHISTDRHHHHQHHHHRLHSDRGTARSRSEDRGSSTFTVPVSSRHRDYRRDGRNHHQHQHRNYHLSKDNQSGSATPIATPCETPIEDVIRRVSEFRKEYTHQASSTRLRTSDPAKNYDSRAAQDTRDNFRSRSENNFGNVLDYSQGTASKHSQDSGGGFKSKSAANFHDIPDVPVKDGSKRTSFGAVTKFSNGSKHSSESNLFDKVNNPHYSNAPYQREKQVNDTSLISLDSYTGGERNNISHDNRSADSSMSLGGFIASAPASPPKSCSKSKAGAYKYTSLRNSRGKEGIGFTSSLSKAMSTSNITDSRTDRVYSNRDIYKLPDNLFGDAAQVLRSEKSRPQQQQQQPRAGTSELDSDRSTTPTNLANFITTRTINITNDERFPQPDEIIHHGSGAAPHLRKPTPKKATTSSRSSSESRLPRPSMSTMQSNNNNNNILDIQSVGSSFERYCPDTGSVAEDGKTLRHQGSIQGRTYLLSAERQDGVVDSSSQATAASGEGEVTGVRLSWENPPSAYNLTLYSNKQN